MSSYNNHFRNFGWSSIAHPYRDRVLRWGIQSPWDSWQTRKCSWILGCHRYESYQYVIRYDKTVLITHFTEWLFRMCNGSSDRSVTWSLQLLCLLDICWYCWQTWNEKTTSCFSSKISRFLSVLKKGYDIDISRSLWLFTHILVVTWQS